MGVDRRFFESEHLPSGLADVAAEVQKLQEKMDSVLPNCAEKVAGMRKLLEVKDCFVRAKLQEIWDEGD